MITLAAGELEAAFAPEAAMVCCSLRHRGEELLAQRGGLREYAEQGRTMGIPLLHPWANRLAEWSYEALGRRVELQPGPVKRDGETGLPMHGVLPRPFEVLEADGTRVVAEQHFSGDAFPFEHVIRLEASLADGLRIEVTVSAIDAEVPIAFGFHPYFTLPGVARADYELELPPMRQLELSADKVPTGSVAAFDGWSGRLGEREFDDAFDEVADGLFAVSGGGRRIELRFAGGYSCAQVYAPAGKDLVCFEPMTAPGNALRTGAFAVATPDEPYRAGFSIEVRAV